MSTNDSENSGLRFPPDPPRYSGLKFPPPHRRVEREPGKPFMWGWDDESIYFDPDGGDTKNEQRRIQDHPDLHDAILKLCCEYFAAEKLSSSPPTVEQVVALMEKLPNDNQRLDVMAEFCHGCGSGILPCCCQNDE